MQSLYIFSKVFKIWVYNKKLEFETLKKSRYRIEVKKNKNKKGSGDTSSYKTNLVKFVILVASIIKKSDMNSGKENKSKTNH